MGTNAENAFEKFKAAEGQEQGVGEWFEIDQSRIDGFADVTLDHQFIHVDPEAAKAGPFGGTIAHGFLTLSMLVHLDQSIPSDASFYEGVAMGINYGFEKVRFITPVKVDAKIRARSTLSGVELKNPTTIQTTRTMTVEIEGEERPALVADWLTRIIYS